MEFGEAYSTYGDMIERRAFHEYIRGYDHDDIVAEMLVCLWRACDTYDGDRSFPSYWWSIWMNRRVDLTRFVQRRPVLQPVGENNALLDRAYGTYVLPVPDHTGRLGRLVWKMIALGVPRDDILAQVGLSKRHYYDLIHEWKNPQVRTMLSSDGLSM